MFHLRCAALAALILTAACGKKNEAAAADSGKPADAAPVAVRTVVVEKRPMPRFLVVTGSLKAQSVADLAADTSGKVIQTFVERGSQVRKGDPLLRLDVRSASLTAAQARAQAQLAQQNAEFAKVECERAEQLFKSGSIPKSEYDRRKTACETSVQSVEIARAGAALAGKSLADATIRAPFDGVVAERTVELGQYVQPQTKVASIVSVDPLRLEISVPENQVAAVRKGQSIEFGVAGYPEDIFQGTIRFISPVIRPVSRDFIAEAVVPNKDQRLRPGMFAQVKLRLGDEPVPVVPAGAVHRGEVASSVFAVVQGRAVERVVQLGESREGQIAVTSGVQVGEKLIINPGQPGANVRDGARVQE